MGWRRAVRVECMPPPHTYSGEGSTMRCLNCRHDGIPTSVEVCPKCGVHLPSLLRDVLPLGTSYGTGPIG